MLSHTHKHSHAHPHIDLQAELDDIVCEDCPLCGEVLIETIDEPFVKPEEQAAYVSKWTLN